MGAAWLVAVPAVALLAAGGVGLGLDLVAEEVRIYRDAYGVPHVHAADWDALWHANGYVQAQDRLFQMDVLRHVARGDAAAVLGPDFLASDLVARRELYTAAEREAQLAGLDPEWRQALEAFAAGVNRALAEMTAQGHLPAEFPALNHAPEPWTALDTVAVAVLLLDQFGTGGGDELDNAALLARLQATLPTAGAAEAAFRDLAWGVHATSYPTIPEAAGAFTGPVAAPKALADLPLAQAALLAPAAAAVPFGLPPGTSTPLPAPRFAGLADLKWGSNALLVAPSASAEGRALVGGGPQTGYFAPPVLYEVGLHGAGLDVVGVGVAGAPGVVLGRTGAFAWTVTSGISDQVDVVGLPAAGARSYAWPAAQGSQVLDLECRDETHLVATPPGLGLAPPQALVQEVCVSHLGPVRAVTLDPQGQPTHFWAAQKVHRGLEGTAAQEWLGLGAVQDLAGFREAFEDFAFTFNFHYAGPEGACYHHVGAQPVRHPALDPRLPAPAGDAWGWQGALTGAQLPRACNPAQGYFANWNNLPQRGWGAGDQREIWGSVHRVQRLEKEVRDALAADADGRLDLAQVKAIVRAAAEHDSTAAAVVPLLLPHAPPAAGAALAAWAAADYPWADADGDGFYDHAGHAWYDAVRADLQVRLFADELGPHHRGWNPDPATHSDPHAGDHGPHGTRDALLRDALAGGAGHAWCDDVATPAVETCAGQVAAAFAAAAAAGQPGPLAVHRSPFTNIGAGPAFSLPMTNRASYSHFHDPVGDAALQSSRSGSALPPGQSGHLSALDFAVLGAGGAPPVHMADQLALYREFGLKPVPATEAQAKALAGAPQVLLVPMAR